MDPVEKKSEVPSPKSPARQPEDALTSSGDLVKITFRLPEDDQAGWVETEGLWAKNLGDGRYRIDNVPFFLYGVSLDDIVSAEDVDGLLVFREVISPGGHSTYRVYIPEPDTAVAAGLDERLAEILALGASLERANRRLIAIDVPPDADIGAIYKMLEAGEDATLWEFEEGHFGRLDT
jgi:hypothetical protein